MHTVLVCFIFCAQYLLNTDAVELDYYWRDYSACDLPADAIQLLKGIYVGQVNCDGDIPAVIYHPRGLAITDIDGRRFVYNNIKILCSSYPSRFYWHDVNFGVAPNGQTTNAVKVGYDEQLYDNLFLGKLLHEDKWRFGKVVPMEHDGKGLYIIDNSGYTKHFLEFRILKYNTTIPLNHRFSSTRLLLTHRKN